MIVFTSFLLVLRSALALVTLLELFGIVLIVKISGGRKAKAKREEFENEMRSKGQLKFVDRFGNESWGAEEQVRKWRKHDEEERRKSTLLSQVIDEINQFRESQRYEIEIGYHAELTGWLKRRFPSTQVEVQTGSSRPDIVIGNIAIEVKGPTGNLALEGLTTKCLKYSQYYPQMILVLFERICSESNLQEVIRGIRRTFPNIYVITKPNFASINRTNR